FTQDIRDPSSICSTRSAPGSSWRSARTAEASRTTGSSAGIHLSLFATIGEQLVGEADARLRRAPESAAETAQHLGARLQDQAMPIRADREFGALVERELAAKLDRHDEAPLRPEPNGGRRGRHLSEYATVAVVWQSDRHVPEARQRARHRSGVRMIAL